MVLNPNTIKMKNETLQISVTSTVYEAIQEQGLRMILVSPEGTNASKVYTQEEGFKSYEKVEISDEEDGRKRKLTFGHVGSDRVKFPYVVKAGTYNYKVMSPQLRIVLSKAIEPEKDAIKNTANADKESSRQVAG